MASINEDELRVYDKTRRKQIDDSKLDRIISRLVPPVSDESKACIKRLYHYTPSFVDSSFPKARLAGVLVLLHPNKEGELCVTFTTRSQRLRTHPGQTSFPGGKYEDGDPTIEATALREANEEIMLPVNKHSSFLHLTTLNSFTSRGLLIVVPAVYLITKDTQEILDSLEASPDEVDAIFHVPLKLFLGWSNEGDPGEDIAFLKHDYRDLRWPGEVKFRLHRFYNDRLPSPVTGLTADMTVAVALIGYTGYDVVRDTYPEGDERAERMLTSKDLVHVDSRLGYRRYAEGQLSWEEIVHATVLHNLKR